MQDKNTLYTIHTVVHLVCCLLLHIIRPLSQQPRALIGHLLVQTQRVTFAFIGRRSAQSHAWTTLPLLAGSPAFFLPVVLQGGHRVGAMLDRKASFQDTFGGSMPALPLSLPKAPCWSHGVSMTCHEVTCRGGTQAQLSHPAGLTGSHQWTLSFAVVNICMLSLHHAS